MASALSGRFTVYNYARRGRGESGDTPPYAVAREIEDLAAILASTGGEAHVYGVSSGGALALAPPRRASRSTTWRCTRSPTRWTTRRSRRWRTYVTNLTKQLAPRREGAEAVHAPGRLHRGPDSGRRQPPRVAAAEADRPRRWRTTRPAWATVHLRSSCWPRSPSQPWWPPGPWWDPHMGELQPGYFDTAADVVAKSIPNARRHILAGESHGPTREVRGDADRLLHVIAAKPSSAADQDRR